MKKKLLGILFLCLAVMCFIGGASQGGQNALLGGVAVGAVFAVLGVRKLELLSRKSKPIKQAAPIQPISTVPTPPTQPVSTPTVTEVASKPKTFYAPDRIGDCQFAYEYHNVNVCPVAGLDIDTLELGSKVSFAKGEDTPVALLGGQQIGTMLPGRIADMVMDWLKRDEPIFSLMETRIPDKNVIQLFVVFYKNLIEVAERRGLSRVKLVGNANQDMQESISCQEVGDPCYALYDSDKEKWEVSGSSGSIGYLPAKYKNVTITEDAKIIIADIEENDETGKYSVWVYVM